MTMKRNVVVAALAATVMQVAGCGGGDDADAWRDNCTEVRHDAENAQDYFVEDAWACKALSGEWTVVYTFTDNDTRDAVAGIGVGAKVLDKGERWLQTDMGGDYTPPKSKVINGSCTADDPCVEGGDQSLNTGPFEFGESYAGIRGDIVVSEPKTVERPNYSLPEGKRWAIVKVTVSVNDDTKKIVDGYWGYEATADGRSVSVQEASWNGTPAILPGETGTWKVVMKLPETSTEVLFTLTYDMSGPMYWAGQVPADDGEPTYADPAALAEAIGATGIHDTTDHPQRGTEVSAEWRGHEIGVWMPFDEADVDYARQILDDTGYGYVEGDGWFIYADSQEVARAASDAAAEALTE